MFFEIQTNKNEQFPCHYKIDDSSWLNTDNGWSQYNVNDSLVWFKGYCTDYTDINDALAVIVLLQTPVLSGNFVAIIKDGDHLIVTFDKDSPIPLFSDDVSGEITNINPSTSATRVYGNNWLRRNANLTERLEFRPSGRHTYLMSIDDVVNCIHFKLIKKFNYLKNTKSNIKCFFTGGLDSMTCISYLRMMNISFELIDYEHFEYDQFTCNFKQYLNSPTYTMYSHIHHWKEPSVLVSGANGDNIFMRSPDMIRNISEHFEMNWTEYADSYNFEHCANNIGMAFLDKDRFATNDELVDDILNRCLNNPLHWHLGNTLTFTPLRDIEFTKLICQLSPTDLMDQCMNATIQKKLIALNDRALLQYVGKHKKTDFSEIDGIYRLTKASE